MLKIICVYGVYPYTYMDLCKPLESKNCLLLRWFLEKQQREKLGPNWYSLTPRSTCIHCKTLNDFNYRLQMGNWRRGGREGGVFRQDKKDEWLKHPRKDQEAWCSAWMKLKVCGIGVVPWETEGLGTEEKKHLLFIPSCTQGHSGLLWKLSSFIANSV